MLGDVFAQIAAMGGIIYGLVEVFKPIWDAEKRENLGDKITTAVLGVGICLLVPVDIFPTVGLELSVPFVGSVLTGFLMVGGSKGIHDILGLVDSTRIRNGG